MLRVTSEPRCPIESAFRGELANDRYRVREYLSRGFPPSFRRHRYVFMPKNEKPTRQIPAEFRLRRHLERERWQTDPHCAKKRDLARDQRNRIPKSGSEDSLNIKRLR